MAAKSGGAGGQAARPGPAQRPSAHHRLLTAREIEAVHHIPRGTLKSWVARKHLRPFARQGRTHLYRESDVLRCERDRAATCRPGEGATIMDLASGA